MMIAQLSSRKSLRDLTDNLKAQASKLYHLGMRKTSRATLARVNNKQPADLYKERWQIELFFKWIKQNLKIKTFLGTSKTAVLTQVWIALCVYLILAYLKFTTKLPVHAADTQAFTTKPI